MKYYSTLIAITILLSSCLKQSIPDAMMNESSGSRVTATLKYEINGTPISLTVNDADHQSPIYPTLTCQKSNAYVLSGITDQGEFTYTFFTDSLKVGNY